MRPAVHQVLATLGYGDAIGNEVLGIQRVLRAAGYESEIFVETADPRLEDLTDDYRELPRGQPSRTTSCSTTSRWDRARRGWRTPCRSGWRSSTTTSRRPNTSSTSTRGWCSSVISGRRELGLYAHRCELGLGDSEYNRQELEALGFPRTDVLPVVPDFSHLAGPPNFMQAGAFDDAWVNVLFVGRMIPNKSIDDVIRCFHAYNSWFNPRSRLLLVGSHAGFERYVSMLQDMIDRLEGAERAFPRSRQQRRARRLLRAGRRLPVRERARGLLRAVGRVVPHGRAGAGLCGRRGAGHHGRRGHPLPRQGSAPRRGADRHRSPPIGTSPNASSPARTRPWSGSSGRTSRARCSASSTGCAARRRASTRRWPSTSGPRSTEAEEMDEIRPFRPGGVPGAARRAADVRRRERMHDRQPVGAGRAPRRCRRRFGAARPRPAAADGTPVGRLRVDHRRGPRRRRAPVCRSGVAPRGPDDLPLRARLADDRGVRAAAPRPGPAVPQRHAGALLRALGHRACSGWPSSVARTSRSLVGHTDLALGDSDYNRQELEQMGFGNTGVFPIAVDLSRITAPIARPALEDVLDDGLQNFLFVGRIAPNKKVEDHHPAGGVLQALRRRALPVHLRRQDRRRAALLQHGAGARRRVPDAAGSLHLHRSGARRGAGGLLPHGERLHLAVRARRLLRAAARGDGRGRAGAGLRVDRRCPTRSAARASRSSRRIWSSRPSCSASWPSTTRLRGRVIAGQRRRLQRLRRRPHHARAGQRAAVGMPQALETHREDRIHRSALRRGDSRRLGVPLPPDRRADGGQARRRRADDLRARLHHLEERVSRRHGPHPRRDGAALRQRPDPRHPELQPVLRLDLPPRAHPRGRDAVARGAGPLVAGPGRVPPPPPQALRRADLLHLSLRADRAGPRRRPGAQHPRADRARRAGHPPRALSGDVRAGRRRRLQHRGGEALPEDDLRHAPRRRGDRRLRRGPAPGRAAPAARGAGATRRSCTRRCRRTCAPGARPSGAGTGCRASSCSTAAASTPARAARS